MEKYLKPVITTIIMWTFIILLLRLTPSGMSENSEGMVYFCFIIFSLTSGVGSIISFYRAYNQ